MVKNQSTSRNKTSFKKIALFLTTFLPRLTDEELNCKAQEINKLFVTAKRFLKISFNLTLGVRINKRPTKKYQTQTLRFFIYNIYTPAVKVRIKKMTQMMGQNSLSIQCHNNKDMTGAQLGMITAFLESLILISKITNAREIARETAKTNQDTDLLMNFARMASKADVTDKAKTAITKTGCSKELAATETISSKTLANPHCGTKSPKRKKEEPLVLMKQNKKHQPQKESAVDTTTQLGENNKFNHRQEAKRLWMKWSSDQKPSHGKDALKP